MATDDIQFSAHVQKSQESEIAYWRRQYEENYEAAYCVRLDAYAVTSSHEFITRRMENMGRATMELIKLVGKQETAQMLFGVPSEETMTSAEQ